MQILLCFVVAVVSDTCPFFALSMSKFIEGKENENEIYFKMIRTCNEMHAKNTSQKSRMYEDEQHEKKALAEQLRTELDKDKEQNDGIEKFITKVKAITDIQELIPEIVREFISRIDVYAPYRENKQRHQRIDIYYHGIGYVFIPEPEEVEEMFQEHLRDRKDNIKVKTA